MAGIRWCVEECFQAAKGEVGLDQQTDDDLIPLTVNEIRHLFAKLVVQVSGADLLLEPFLRAEATLGNAASRKVLNRTGFVPVGTTTLRGRPALQFVRRLDAHVS